MKVDYGAGEKELLFSGWTLVLYEQQFGGDLIQDLFGKVEVRKSDVETALRNVGVDEGLQDAPEAPDEDPVLFTSDYTQTNWTAVLKALWAGLKTADDALPGFAQWSRGLGAIDLGRLQKEIVPEAMRMFFRSDPVQGEGEGEGA